MAHFADKKRTVAKERVEYPLKMMHAYPRIIIGWGAHTMVGNEARKLRITNALIKSLQNGAVRSQLHPEPGH